MIGLGIYFSGFIVAYILLRFISSPASDWSEIWERTWVSMFSWLTAIMIIGMMVSEWVSDVIWNYKYRRKMKYKDIVKTKREPIKPPKWL